LDLMSLGAAGSKEIAAGAADKSCSFSGFFPGQQDCQKDCIMSSFF